MESGRVCISRASRTVEFPACFQLVAAMNPCPCGFAGDSRRVCRCSPDRVLHYQHRISGPFLDRIDMRLTLGREATPHHPDEGTGNESSQVVRARVVRAVAQQRARAGCLNARLNTAQIRRWCRPDPASRKVLDQASEQFALSGRAQASILRVARTIADLGDQPEPGIQVEHMTEALALRAERRLQD